MEKNRIFTSSATSNLANENFVLNNRKPYEQFPDSPPPNNFIFTSGDDYYFGNNSAEILNALAGNDKVHGAGGD
ncbi:MAG: hypothetical protein SFT90_03470, partial [Rickettsiales bacterium]|nr:hypothetical protein [Rickettsiales bacterium]